MDTNSRLSNVRVRAKVGEAAPGQGHDGKWFFEIGIWDIAATAPLYELWVGPWDSEKIARQEMANAAEMLSHEISQFESGKPSTGFLDLKNGGAFRKWTHDA